MLTGIAFEASLVRTPLSFFNNHYILDSLILPYVGLGVTCSSRDPRFAGRWIFSGRKNPEHKSSGKKFKLGVPSLRFQAR